MAYKTMKIDKQHQTPIAKPKTVKITQICLSTENIVNKPESVKNHADLRISRMSRDQEL